MQNYTCIQKQKAHTFYLDALKDLTESQKMEINGSYTIAGTKGDNAVAVTITTDQSNEKKQTMVSISIAPKPQ